MEERRHGGKEEGLAGGRRARWLLLLPLLLASTLLLAREARAQADVVGQLRYQRFLTRSAELLREIGDAVPPRPPERLESPTLYTLWHDRIVAARQAYADSLAEAARRAVLDSLAALPPSLPEIAWAKTEADDQGRFLALYRETFWRAVSTPASIDSVATPELRARLNGLFGAPTRNAAAAEQEGYAGSEYVQFEYWLVVNDTIPILVLDRDGPFGRGLLVAGDEAHAAVLPLVKADLARRLAEARPTPYADYYHRYADDQWFRTGFDGATYFTRESRRPRWVRRLGRNEKWRIFR